MPDRRDKPNPLPKTPTEVPARPTTAPPDRGEPAITPGTPAPNTPAPETGTPETGTPTMPEPPAPWLKERPDRKRGTGEPGRRREDETSPNGPRRS